MKVQLSLLNVFLMTVVVALGVAYWLQNERNQWYEARLPGLKDAARELYLTDPKLLHAVQLQPEWYSEKKWQVYVPEQKAFHLQLASEQILNNLGPYSKNENKYPKPEAFIEFSSGIHEIELRQRKIEKNETSSGGTEIEVLVDGASTLVLQKDPSWNANSQGSTSTSDVSTCKSFAADQKVRLIHSEISTSGRFGGPDKRHNGILLWIEAK